EADFIETRERLFEIHVRKVSAEKRLVLEPAADRFQKDFRQLLSEIARGIDVDVFFVRHDANEFLFPRPSWMRRDDFHAREIACQRIKVNRPAVIQGDAAAAVVIGPEHRKTDMKQERLGARLKNLPNGVKFSIARIKSLIGRMKFEADDFWIARQLLSIAGDLRYILSIDVQCCEN